jgi:putative methyltransferase (TIGR04325 family)
MKTGLLKSFAKEILPPIFLNLLKKNFNKFATYESYAAALIDAEGYEDNTLVKVVVAKGKTFSETFALQKEVDLMSLRIFVGIASALKNNKLKVIDFGGAAGTHYYLAKSILSKDIVIDWRIIETTQMVKEAKAQGLENTELSFYDSIESASNDEEFDLVFASSSVHYTPSPYDLLEKLTKINANKLVITRTPITDVSTVLLQRSKLSANGVGEIPRKLGVKDKIISYPATMMSKEHVENILLSFGEIKLKIREDKSAYASAKKNYDMWGYVVAKNDRQGQDQDSITDSV